MTYLQWVRGINISQRPSTSLIVTGGEIAQSDGRPRERICRAV